MINHDIHIEEKIFQMYENIKVGQNYKCLECRSKTINLSKPVSLWFVGDNFEDSKFKVLFIGKNARNEPKVLKNGVGDVTKLSADLWLSYRPYFSYTRGIVERIYGKSDGSHIAFTNCIKCNNSSGKDTTTTDMKNYCIKELKVLRKEIDIIKPKHIVFYTSWRYDSYFCHIFDDIEKSSNTSNTRKIGKYEMPWLEFNADLNGNVMRVLRVGHPERKNKQDFVTAISAWILGHHF